MRKPKMRRKPIDGTVWLFTVLLLLLVAATAALVTSFVKNYTGEEQNVIAIFPGDGIVKGDETITVPTPANPTPDMDIQGKEDASLYPEMEWEVDKSIDLFRTTYTDEHGDVIIESGNEDKVIAPGASNKYHFSIKNTGNISLDYTIKLSTVFTLSDQRLPFRVRLSSGDQWILGGKDKWRDPAELTDIEIRNTLEHGRYVNYTLEWQWPFESESDVMLGDLNDTIITGASITEDVNFTLAINTVSKLTPGAVALDPSGNPIIDFVTKRPEVVYMGGFFLVIVPLLLATLAMLPTVLRKKGIIKEGPIFRRAPKAPPLPPPPAGEGRRRAIIWFKSNKK